jgi:hypothetical protein
LERLCRSLAVQGLLGLQQQGLLRSSRERTWCVRRAPPIEHVRPGQGALTGGHDAVGELGAVAVSKVVIRNGAALAAAARNALAARAALVGLEGHVSRPERDTAGHRTLARDRQRVVQRQPQGLAGRP